MLLQDTIDAALALTGEMHASLEEGRPEAWDDLLARRAAAMVAFEDAHRAADEKARLACRAGLEALSAADCRLQECAREALASADEAFRERLGAAPAPASAYDAEPVLGAIDRQA